MNTKHTDKEVEKARRPEQLDLTQVKGIGKQMAQTLGKLGLFSIQDLLFHLPFRYIDRTKITPISQLFNGTSALIQGKVVKSDILFGRRRSLAVFLEDSSGKICLRFFHFNQAQQKQMSLGTSLRCYGDVRLGSTGLEMYHPEYSCVDPNSPLPVDERLTPIYSLTEGLSQQRLRKFAAAAIATMENSSPEELLPKDTNDAFLKYSLSEALTTLHLPPADIDVNALMEGKHPCQQRLAFEELLAHHLARQKLREEFHKRKAARIHLHPKSVNTLREHLPFKLTGAQMRVIGDIEEDLVRGRPMLRMIQGDVGSGKTLVAAHAAIHVAKSGLQVAVVAPTEILAEQHFLNFAQWLRLLDIKVAWLVGRLSNKKRIETLALIASGEAQVIVGTHALFQDDVKFLRLGLSIIDEQHRFGVDQRLSLRQKAERDSVAHQLVMTATPIPRTLAMTAYSELDYSVIDELPPGRQAIKTVLVSQKRKHEIVERIKDTSNQGRQVYWVCPLVEDSETIAAANAEQTQEFLRDALPTLRVGLVHGRLKSEEKEANMQAFKRGEINLLVATTVIEVGVDVPNASLMVIENPERLGLAQLHQLRGRVGRGSVQSFCVLLYGDSLSRQAQERLQVLRDTNDGFKVAEMDLNLRGPGELLGTRQTGDMQYRLADLTRDAALIPKVHQVAAHMLSHERQKVEKILTRWLGKNQDYAQV